MFGGHDSLLTAKVPAATIKAHVARMFPVPAKKRTSHDGFEQHQGGNCLKSRRAWKKNVSLGFAIQFRLKLSQHVRRKKK